MSSLVGAAGNDSLPGPSEDAAGGSQGGADSLFWTDFDDSLPGAAGDGVLSFATSGAYFLGHGLGACSITGLGSGATGADDVEFIGAAAGNAALGADNRYVCFAGGTRIRTDRGNAPVESLRAGDLVATISGRGAPLKRVLWVGRRRVNLVGHAHADALVPIRIRAGALAENTPSRDLLVSSDHCVFLDGVLVPAGLLVNGASIVAETSLAEVTYYHVELEVHDVLLAEGAGVESWIDSDSSACFENPPTALADAGDSLAEADFGWGVSRTCAPLLQGGERLAAIRAQIEARIRGRAAAWTAAPASRVGRAETGRSGFPATGDGPG
jgi:hypothetical protein